MTSASLLDAWDTIAASEGLLERLEAASLTLSRKPGLKEEKAWLETAVERVRHARKDLGDLKTRAMALPELEPLREEHARTLQNAAVDAVERLQAGITFHVGTRAPLLEMLYGKLKLPVLRRCDRQDFEGFCKDFEKRLNSSYAKRMFADPAFNFVTPALEQVIAAFVAWRTGFSPTVPTEEEARGVRDELDAASRLLELPMRQARLLAEAALTPVRNGYEESGIGQRPRRRSTKSAVTESEGGDDVTAAPAEEAPSPDEPSPEELAELAAAEAPVEAPAPVPPPPAVEEAPVAAAPSKAPRKRKPAVQA